jgi:SpoVK/Ycf46/Vps4 family AAA+-type ATPase
MKAPKLYLTAEVKQQVLDILGPLKNPELWKAMALPFAPHPYAVVRMDAPTGCGKTALCNYMARQLKQEPVRLDFSKIASEVLGHTEKAIGSAFDAAHMGNINTMILEECEGLLWTRDMVDEDTTYHLNFVNEVLRQIDRLIARETPTLLLLTTNRPDLLDSAIESRITDVIRMGVPEGEHAMKIWASKLPPSVRDAISEEELQELADLKLAPRQMEQGVLRVCRKCAVAGRMPVPADFLA